MNDIFLEGLRTAVLFAITYYLFHEGRRRSELFGKGWRYIVWGFALLLLGSAVDITDNFESLNRFVVIGDTETQAVIEKMIGFLGGFILIFVGLLKWIPKIVSSESLKLTNDKLEQLNEEIDEARNRAEASTEAKGQFLANMSHEIRTPMNGVLGMTELLFDTRLTQEQQELTLTVKQSAESLLKIINDILDFSKIESGKVELSPITFSIKKLIDELEKINSFKAEETGLSLITNISSDVPDYLVGDSDRLRQVIVNLLGNAMKFTPRQGTVLLNVTLEEENDKGLTLFFHVKDTGIGVPQERQVQIFEAFSQADSSTTRKFGGTGLGLSISSELVRLMGGEIGLKSEQGKGSAFYFTAQFGIGSKEQEQEQEQEHLPDTANISRPLQILLAEDNAINQKLAVKILGKAGHTVQLANNGKEALELFEAGSFDIILMDMQMPIMSGEEATALIREQLNGSQIPIVALTANAMLGDEEKYISQGMDGYVSKPINMKELFSVIEDLTQVD